MPGNRGPNSIATAGSGLILENAVTQNVCEEECVAEKARLNRPGGEQGNRLPLQNGFPALGDPKIENCLGRGLGPRAHGLGRAELGLQLAEVGDGCVGPLEWPIGLNLVGAAQYTE